MKSLARIQMLVERGAVEAAETERIGGKMRGHPIENHADPALMQRIDEVAEIVGRAEARGRREIAGDLVAPRAGERMFHHWHHFDMRKAHVGDIIAELVRHLAISKRTIALARVASP